MTKFRSKNIGEKPLVYFVGLSTKPNCEPLALKTNTGCIIEKIIYCLPPIKIIKTNLVRNPPMNNEGKLRYPNFIEMEDGWSALQKELLSTVPNLIVTLGQQVSFFLRSRMGVKPARTVLPSDFSSQQYLLQASASILSVHHPSHVVIYRRKDIESYIKNVALSISTLIDYNSNFSET